MKVHVGRREFSKMVPLAHRKLTHCHLMLFNIFINDLIYVVNDVCPLYNYADDNTLAFFHSDMDILRTKLEEGSSIALDWFDENHMKANISKFQSIILRPKGSISDVSFCISEHILKPIPCVKLLGVKIDDRLSFDDHISSICLRVSYQINGLRRIMKYMTIGNRISIYNAFLAANFTYCNTVWHFCSSRGMYMLEKVHKKALRVVLNDYISSYRDLLDKVSKQTLYVARIKAIAIEAYKCYVNENPPYINAMFDSVDKPYKLRGGPLAEQPKVNTTYSGLNTFTYQAAKIWNSLPSHLKEASSLFDFKQRILKWPGTVCMWLLCFMPLIRCLIPIYLRILLLLWMHLLIADESSRIFYMCVLYVSSHFHLYHTHRSFFIQSPNSLRLMLFICSLCDSK